MASFNILPGEFVDTAWTRPTATAELPESVAVDMVDLLTIEPQGEGAAHAAASIMRIGLIITGAVLYETQSGPEICDLLQEGVYRTESGHFTPKEEIMKHADAPPGSPAAEALHLGATTCALADAIHLFAATYSPTTKTDPLSQITWRHYLHVAASLHRAETRSEVRHLLQYKRTVSPPTRLALMANSSETGRTSETFKQVKVIAEFDPNKHSILEAAIGTKQTEAGIKVMLSATSQEVARIENFPEIRPRGEGSIIRITSIIESMTRLLALLGIEAQQQH